ASGQFDHLLDVWRLSLGPSFLIPGNYSPGARLGRPGDPGALAGCRKWFAWLESALDRVRRGYFGPPHRTGQCRGPLGHRLRLLSSWQVFPGCRTAALILSESSHVVVAG